MAGFFKKLFNRITGKKDEVQPVEEQVALPAPEPATPEQPLEFKRHEVETGIPEPVEERLPPEPEIIEAEKIESEEAILRPSPKAKARPPAKTSPRDTVKAKKSAAPAPSKSLKPETRKPETKKSGPKKAEPEKPEPKPVARKTVAAPVKVEKPAPAPKPAKPEAKPIAKAKLRKTSVEEEIAVPVIAPEPEIVQPPPEPPTVVAEPPQPHPAIEREPELPPPAPAPRLETRSRLQREPSPPPPQPETEPERQGWFRRLKDGLSKSSKSLTGSITSIFTKRKLDAATLQDLEDTLIQADLGIAVSERIIKAVSTGRYDKEIDPEEVKQILAQEVASVLQPVEVPFNFGAEKPFVILVVGVNGSGKTTTIGKLGAIAAGEGFKIKFAACDTFRAAAIEQLTVWGKRVGAETISRPPGSDAAGLAFDAMKAAQADATDILFIDTAGRLHNKTYLMDELDKVVRVIKKYDANAPHAVLLVLDATTGQNALAQAEAFTKVAGVTGLIMTKLDGTARGGILVAIAERFRLPIHAIGVGETLDDLQPFDARAFARAIAGLEER